MNGRDVVIIGAGVVGSSIAAALSAAGRSVLVLDKGGAPGDGSTSASSSILRFHYSTWESTALAWEAKHSWDDFADLVAAGRPEHVAELVTTTGLAISAPNMNLDRVLANFRSLGIPFESLDTTAVAEEFPALSVASFYPPKAISDDAFWSDPQEEITGALLSMCDGYISDPRLVAANLLGAARLRGTEVRLRESVVGIDTTSAGVRSVTLASGESVPCGTVVNAAGPYSHAVNTMAGAIEDMNVATRALRQEVHWLPTDDPAITGLPTLYDPDLGIYIRRDLGGVLVGGQEPECDRLEWVEDPDVFDGRPTAAAYEAQAMRAARRLPDLKVPARPSGVVGLYDVSDDWTPIYDRSCVEGFYMAIGTSGNQFKNAPVIGLLMADLIRACESGANHDVRPHTWTGPWTGNRIGLGRFSRLRSLNKGSPRSVNG